MTTLKAYCMSKGCFSRSSILLTKLGENTQQTAVKINVKREISRCAYFTMVIHKVINSIQLGSGSESVCVRVGVSVCARVCGCKRA